MMDQEKLHHPEDDFTTVDATMISSTSPYQSTTEPVPHRRSIVAGFIVEMNYIKSIAGLVKVAEILFSIIVAICVGVVPSCTTCAPISFMQFVSISALIFTTIVFIIFSLNLQSKVEFINWILSDLINSVLFFLLYLIGSSVLAANVFHGAEKAATAFGFFSTILFAVSSWLAYKAYMLERRKRNSPISHIKGVADTTETRELA